MDFRAVLTIVGNTLTVQLFNDSEVASNTPDDMLSSYFFDIVNGSNNRPLLTYVSAVGDIWSTDKNAADSLHGAGMDLMAVDPGDRTWEFRALDAGQAPLLGFGLGTVGNSSMAPNNFHGNIVDGFDYSIYAGDVSTQSISGYLLVKPSATFTFSGVDGFTEADISPDALFGLGTAPDSTIRTPEPMTGVLLALGGLLLRRRKR